MDAKSIYMDIIGNRAGPGIGDVIQCIGKSGRLNSTYLVIHSSVVKRRIKAYPRYQMRVVVISETDKKEQLAKGANYFELRWYPRKKRKSWS